MKLKNAKCDSCNARLIVNDNERTIVKNRLMIIDEKKGVIEIKCRECGAIKTIVSKN